MGEGGPHTINQEGAISPPSGEDHFLPHSRQMQLQLAPVLYSIKTLHPVALLVYLFNFLCCQGEVLMQG